MTIDQDTNVNSNQNDGLRFAFGKNWSDYIDRHFSEAKLDNAQQHLLNFVKLKNLSGKTFLDIGCGSGLHSLAAYKSGAEEIISFDYDINSVTTAKKLHAYAGSPSNWKIMSGSVLDQTFIGSLPKFDIVYSWGVLHHTGHMWDALINASSCMNKTGVLYIALYSKDVYVSPPYEYWLGVKRTYNQASFFKRKWMEWEYAWNDSIRELLKQHKNPFVFAKIYNNTRGMSYWHDVKDWLGGYPMEFAGNYETIQYCAGKLNLELINMNAGEGNTEYLLRIKNLKNYWDDMLSLHPIKNINSNFDFHKGHAWSTSLPLQNLGDPKKFMLYENNLPMGWPSSNFEHIALWGGGRYFLEGENLYISTLNKKNPEDNKYSYRINFI